MLTFPQINPIALEVGPLVVRWYALAYVAGVVAGYAYVKALVKRWAQFSFSKEALDNLMVAAIIGVMLGGRLGYAAFYQSDYYLEHPLEILKLWKGGMAFHGGMLGAIGAFYWYARRYRLPYLSLMDAIACAAPIGLFFGRMANFINGELYGRVSDVPWAMVFPRGGPEARHPSQLYEAGLEGVLLFIVLWGLARYTQLHTRHGVLAGVFLVAYGIARTIIEQFREPDEQLGFILGSATMGQLLSAPMLLLGVLLIVRELGRAPARRQGRE